jgi:hypothetical protein
MRLSEIRIGERYAVTIGRGRDADQTIHLLGMDTGDLPTTHSQRYHQAVVLDVGVPYQKGRHGVRIEYTYTQQQYGDTSADDYQTTHTNRVTVHFTALVCPWSELPVHQLNEEIDLHERLGEWRAERERGWPSHQIQEPLTRADRSRLERQLQACEGFRTVLTEVIDLASQALQRDTLSRAEDLRISDVRADFRWHDPDRESSSPPNPKE